MDERMRKMKMAQGAQWMKDQAASGLSKQAWCRENGVPRASFFYYQRILRTKALDDHPIVEKMADNAIAGAVTSPALVEIPVCTVPAGSTAVPVSAPEHHRPAAQAREDRVEISCGAFSVRIPENISENSLTRILKAVKNAD